MGLGSSRGLFRQTGMDQDSDPPSFEGNFDDGDPDLPSILGYLVRSGQIRLTQYSGDSDCSGEEEELITSSAISTKMFPKPDVQELQKNDIYCMVKKSSGKWPERRWLHNRRSTVSDMIYNREIGTYKSQQFTHGDMCAINSRYLPNQSCKLEHYPQKTFCGVYSKDGNIFLTACQDQYIRIYNTRNDNFKLVKRIRAHDVGWSILDTAFSPDGCHVAYSSWSDSVHLCSLDEDSDVHEALQFEPGDHSFCIFSLMFSSDNREILGGANDGNLYVYDRESSTRLLKIEAHDSDVNTVRFADSSSQILYSGGDDGLCKVWDRRTLKDEKPIPVGVLAGHCDGITYIDSKGDARFFISNSKDQTMKLWDIRCFSDQSGIEETKKAVSSQHWDYRWQQVPKRMSKQQHLRGDSSVMTYRGHRIQHTLIRCKFSPEATTGQGYIYTGCASGSVVVYDVLTGKVACRLNGHKACVRDVSWHPYKNIIISASWDGNLLEWTYGDERFTREISSRKSRESVHKSRETRENLVRSPDLFE